MHGVGGDALGAVDGAGVAERWTSATYSAGRRTVRTAGVLHGQVRPRGGPVTVQRSPFLTQSVAETRSRGRCVRVMISVADGGLVAVGGAGHLAAARWPWPARRWSRARAVELGDQLAGGGEHERVESGLARSACQAAKHCSVGARQVADVHPAVVEVEAERGRVAVSERKRGRGFGRVGEADGAR